MAAFGSFGVDTCSKKKSMLVHEDRGRTRDWDVMEAATWGHVHVERRRWLCRRRCMENKKNSYVTSGRNFKDLDLPDASSEKEIESLPLKIEQTRFVGASWYQSSTACRKPVLLVDVESSVRENYLWTKMSCENHLRILFTPYPIRSISGSTYLYLI